MARPKQRGRGAREQHRADQRQEYAQAIAPHFLNLVQIESPAARVLLWGDELVELAAKLAPHVPDGAVALITAEFERWEAATAALAAFPNVTVVQELAELRDPDDFPTLPWTMAVFLVPFQLGTKTVHDLMREIIEWLTVDAPFYAGGSRMYDWQVASERLSALAGPLETLYVSEPIRIVRGRSKGKLGSLTQETSLGLRRNEL